jgi:GT2 family glycosyltransferase
LTTVSFVTCVSDPSTYADCVVESLEKSARCETVPIDNEGNRYSAAQALNLGLDRTQGEIVVFCHQDVVFPPNWADGLLRALKTLGQFGVAGPAGRCSDGTRAGHVIDHGKAWHYPPLPREAETLDELCLVIRRDSELRFDESFNHFHLYGADLCLQARLRDLPCYALDCCLEHLSGGNKDEHWHEEKERFIRKWWPQRRQVGRKIHLTSGTIRLHSPWVRLLRRLLEGKGR